MSELWKTPLPVPMFAHAIAEELIERKAEEGKKPKAFDTPFRFSDVLACSRKLALDYAGFEETNPMDPASLVVTMRGTLMHELVQEAIGKRFPGAQFEIKGLHADLASGHIDALIDIDGVLYSWELKNVGQYKFDHAIGVQRQRGGSWLKGGPEGPALSAIAQGGVNALAHGADHVVVANISMEAVSKQVGSNLGMNDLQRIMAEWLIPREVWEPLAHRELARLQVIKNYVDEGWLPEASAINDDGEPEKLNPNLSRRKWNCWYCPYLDLCSTLPTEAVQLDDEAEEAS